MDLPNEVARRFGVTRMPMPLKWFDTREVLKHLPPGFTMQAALVHVLFEVDIDETGKVTHVAGVSRPHLPPNVHVIGVELHPEGPRQMRRLTSRLMPCETLWSPLRIAWYSDQRNATVAPYRFAGFGLVDGIRAMTCNAARPPNKRLKPAGGDRFKGSGVLCP